MNEQQLETQEQAPSIPLTRRFTYGFTCGVIGGLIGLITNIATGQGVYGGILGFSIGAGVGGYIGPEIIDWFNAHVELPDGIRRRIRPSAYQVVDEERQLLPPSPTADPTKTAVLANPIQEELPRKSDGQESVDEGDLFSDIVPGQNPPFPRISQDDVIAHSYENDFSVIVGQSVKKEPRHAKRIRFRKRHMKCIGASQFGKSTNAAYLLDTIFKTHDPDHVQVAILDMEDRTGQIFEDDPHVATILRNGQPLKLHARSIQEVFAHLGYLYTLVEQRYKLSLEDQEQLPLLIVYFEEFLAFKDELKNALYRGTSEEREQAKRNFVTFMNRFKHIAQRGLKVYVQLLVCAQVEYRDEDLVEAFANIVHGFAFCVKPTAAQAAGFFQGDLLADNAKAKLQGQCVCEMPEMNDIILVPQFDIDERIRAMQKKRKSTTFLMVLDDEKADAAPVIQSTEQQEQEESSSPSVVPMYGYRSTEQAPASMLDQALEAWNEGHTSIRQMAAVLDVSTDVAYQLICKLDAQKLIVREKRVKS